MKTTLENPVAILEADKTALEIEAAQIEERQNAARRELEAASGEILTDANAAPRAAQWRETVTALGNRLNSLRASISVKANEISGIEARRVEESKWQSLRDLQAAYDGEVVEIQNRFTSLAAEIEVAGDEIVTRGKRMAEIRATMQTRITDMTPEIRVAQGGDSRRAAEDAFLERVSEKGFKDTLLVESIVKPYLSTNAREDAFFAAQRTAKSEFAKEVFATFKKCAQRA